MPRRVSAQDQWGVIIYRATRAGWHNGMRRWEKGGDYERFRRRADAVELADETNHFGVWQPADQNYTLRAMVFFGKPPNYFIEWSIYDD